MFAYGVLSELQLFSIAAFAIDACILKYAYI